MKRNILKLRPTQFAIGMMEVDEKISVVQNFSKKELRLWLKENVVPVVCAPDGELYVVDKHHFLSVCFHVGIKKVRVKIIKDFRAEKMSYLQFWTWMRRSRNSYPYCQFGEGPREPLYLPQDIRGLADDPYRSIAWFVRKAGGFENSDRNFAEFKWANFFRSKKLLHKYGRKGLPKALEEAVKLAQSKEARDLPGYEKLNLVEKRVAEASAKSNIKKAISRADKLKNEGIATVEITE